MASKQVLELIATARQNRATKLDLSGQNLTDLPDSIGELRKIKKLRPSLSQMTVLPESICDLRELKRLHLNNNQIMVLPDNIGQLCKLVRLDLSENSISILIDLYRNPIQDLSMLQDLPVLNTVGMFGINLPRRYWTKFSEWKVEWLLDENNAEIRRVLIEQVGYEKICDRLGTIEIDSWHEYTLLKIDNIQIIYQGWRELGREPMVLLKMTCPSTAHIHILRVPPAMTSAEDAIVWVNHGIHPSKFAIQT